MGETTLVEGEHGKDWEMCEVGVNDVKFPKNQKINKLFKKEKIPSDPVKLKIALPDYFHFVSTYLQQYNIRCINNR